MGSSPQNTSPQNTGPQTREPPDTRAGAKGGRPISGKRAETKIRNRHIILQAAKQVFARLGFEAATVRDIIHATPLASGTFYNYFKSKEDIYRAIYDEAARIIRPELRTCRRQAKTTEEFVRESIRIYFRYVEREWKEFYRIRSSAESLRVRFEVPEVIAAYDDLCEDIRFAIQAGILPPTDVDYLATIVLTLCQEMAGEMLRRPDGNPDTATEFVSRLILYGISALPPAKEQNQQTEDNVPMQQASSDS